MRGAAHVAALGPPDEPTRRRLRLARQSIRLSSRLALPRTPATNVQIDFAVEGVLKAYLRASGTRRRLDRLSFPDLVQRVREDLKERGAAVTVDEANLEHVHSAAMPLSTRGAYQPSPRSTNVATRHTGLSVTS